ncbi:hypothetical protein AXG93_3459s1120 [Marchantia polymorpha subsp. ruderalis]|uniref:Uncharacterized protein n=1 Tax=Marchantia polymorpha subsp. ruderalis TaxID=1480154 RepID=A0A176W4D0_MARPO|nr:hypothetical protein AXG93_3459s1120 [Marchantia polymorpha subsp. ruderalis]
MTNGNERCNKRRRWCRSGVPEEQSQEYVERRESHVGGRKLPTRRYMAKGCREGGRAQATGGDFKGARGAGAESEQGTGGRGSKVGYDASQRLEQMRDPEAGVSNGQARQQWQEQSREWSSEGGTGRSGGNVDLHRDMRIRGSVAIAHDRLG